MGGFERNKCTMIDMKTLTHFALAFVVLACALLIIVALNGPIEKETWATLAGVLAVLAALVAVLPALRVLEIQEEALRPHPTPYFDLASRYNLLQLRVKNFGGGVAYNVRLQWGKRPLNHAGEEITSLDHISVLRPQESASVLVGASSSIVSRIAESTFDGECYWTDAAGKEHRRDFVCSVDGNQRQLVYDDELPKTLYELQKVPNELSRIADRLGEFKSALKQVEEVEGAG